MKIVILEQDAAMRALIAEWLRAEGDEVDTSAAPGDDHHVDRDVDIAVIDLVDLRGTGAGQVRNVRRHYPRAVFVGLSTELNRSVGPGSELSRALGVRGLLAKPFSRDELLRAVRAPTGVR